MAEVAVLLHRQIASPARFPAISSFFGDPPLVRPAGRPATWPVAMVDVSGDQKVLNR
ncbi:hypothetical protein JCGZ_01986 [Jatropha curcas]|uniref:Uncharacterized protein n=1 Tax=Jatropha curcas TaxID=180498 RepID=A0A067JG05_JATCU|nr:hypothetical protein JCGZ_01986 [Jatropha curcas]